MNDNENAIVVIEETEIQDADFDLDDLETSLEADLERQLGDLELLEEDRKKIGNPEALGQAVFDEVWNQFGNQIGLDITNETLIQKYDREHPETYNEVKDKVMQDKRYKDANKEMRDKQASGNLKDEYTGKTIKGNDKANLDHVVSRKEIYENQRRKQANLSTEDLANKQENLKPTNEALNKSKGAKSVDKYIEQREEREKSLKEQNVRAKQKIDESNMSAEEKRHAKEKLDKNLNDKLNADDEKMKKADKEARAAINKDIAKGAVKEIGKKTAKDTLKQMAVAALFTMLKEILNALVRYFRSAAKTFSDFLAEMKAAVKSFFTKISGILKNGVNFAVGTIVSEIFGPIVSLFRSLASSLASLIKTGASSLIEAFRYLKNPENKNKPFSVKVAQVGKIVVAALTTGLAIVTGEAFELLLSKIPGMLVEIPLLGSLANIVGMFLGSIVCGVLGAIILNRIDKFIAKRLKTENTIQQIGKHNEILNTQEKLIVVAEAKVVRDRDEAFGNMAERHLQGAAVMRNSMQNIADNDDIIARNRRRYDDVIDVGVSENEAALDDIFNKLASLE